MNKNLYLKEIKRNKKNLLTWSAIAVGFTLMILAIYPYMADMGSDLATMMDKIPKELRKAIGVDTNTWSDILSFYSLYYGIYIILLVGIYTSSTAATIISKEEKDKTSEFLLTQPISRKNIFLTKLGDLFTLTAVIYSIQTLTAIIGILIFNSPDVDFEWPLFWILQLHGLILLFFFTCTGLLLPIYFKPKKNFMGLIVGIIFGSYFIDAISKTASAVEWMGYISPFHYMNFTVTDSLYSFNYVAALILVIIGIIFVYFSFHKYNKRDIVS